MAFDLLNIQPHQVSRDLSGYITYIYGEGKTGKTTLASQMEKSLLLAFEIGYHAIPGIIAQDVKSWGELKQIIRELKKPEVQAAYKCIVIDTVDIAASLCEKYICSQLGIENIGDGGWTNNGWAKVKKEFEETFRTISQYGYALFFISHAKDKTFKTQDGKEFNQIIPTLSNAYNEIVKDMADIYAYAHKYMKEDGTAGVNLTLRSLDNTVDAGCRFKYIEPEIEFNYTSLVNALNTAIDTEAKLTNNKFVTDARQTNVNQHELSFDSLLDEFNGMINQLLADMSESEFQGTWFPKITQITETYLGKGKKVNQCTRDQVELLNLIVGDLKELIKNN